MGDNQSPVPEQITQSAEETMLVIWQFTKKLALLITAIYVAFRYGPLLLYHLRSIIIAVLAAAVLAYALMPGADWLCRVPLKKLRRRPRRVVASLIVLVVFLGLVALSVTLFIDPLKQEIAQFSGKMGEYSREISRSFNRAMKWYTEFVPVNVKNVVEKQDFRALGVWATDYAKRLVTLTTSSVGVILEIFLVPVLAFYFVLDHKSISRELYGLIPKPRRRNAMMIGRGIGEIMQSYIFGQIILCVIAGVLTGLFLTFMGVPYVVVLAMFAAITRAIPIIGPVVSGIPIVLVGILYSGGAWTLPVYLLIFVIVMHFAESKFIMPHLIGERLHLNPAVVIIVLLIGAEFMGLIGMFLAAPVAAIIRELIRFYYIRPGCKSHDRSGLCGKRRSSPAAGTSD
jgi:predicted PurR-regulated permease PerM